MIAVIICAGLLFSGAKYASRRLRKQQLLAKYGDMLIVQRIMAKQVWRGMNTEQLVESWGRPADVGTRVYKSKTVETYKYNQTGKNRFASRVTVENGRVIGWERK